MMIERKEVELVKKEIIILGELLFSEEAEDDEDNVYLRINFNEKSIEKRCSNFFEALTQIRLELEREDIIIRCNGAAENVFPSPMLLSMGVGRYAYHNTLGKQATRNDLVDIFEADTSFEFVTVDKQNKYHSNWIRSL